MRWSRYRVAVPPACWTSTGTPQAPSAEAAYRAHTSYLPGGAGPPKANRARGSSCSRPEGEVATP